MLTPNNVLEEIKRRSGDLGDPIRFYWVVVSAEDDGGDRDGFARSLSQQSLAHPLVPVVLRTPGFVDPNSVMNDLAAVLEDSKADILDGEMRQRISREGYADIVLVSRKELALAVTSSPLFLPGWFPVLPAREVAARIFDLTWTASVPLSSKEAHIDDLRRLLYDLDCALVKRLRVVGESDRRLAMSLLAKIPTEEENVPVADFVSAAQDELDKVRNPRDYRPSRKKYTTVTGLWSVGVATHSDGLPRVAKSLAKALQLQPGNLVGHEESIFAVLHRPTTPIGDPAVRWALDVIVTVLAACQLTTAAAHADEYSRYPVRLVGSLSRDLRRALDGFIKVLEL